MSAFVPVVIASVIASTMSRAWFGDNPAFLVPDFQITSYWEIPAFALLGVTCAIVAICFQSSLIGGDWIARHFRIKRLYAPQLVGCW